MTHTTRYTQKHHQPIAWKGNGMYKWNPERQEWVQMSMEDAIDWIENPTGRRGLVLGFSSLNTLEESETK